MTIRTSEKTVIFERPFAIGGSDEMLPAGTYTVETDEELLEGISFPAYRRILTLIHLHEIPGYPALTQKLMIDPNELDAALKRDQSTAEIHFEPSIRQAHRIQKKGLLQCQAVEENRRSATDYPTSTRHEA